MKTSPVVLPLNRAKTPGLRPHLGLALGLGVAWLALQPARVAAQAATNAPPVRVSYQGFLTDGTGTPLGQPSPQNYTVDFRLYTSPNSVPILWSERQVVTVDKGNFSVILGEGAPISGENNANLGGVIANSADASDRFIGLTVTLSGGTQNTLQPRLRLLTTPYAFLATTARSVTDANGNNRLSWSTVGRGRMEVNGDLNVTTNLTVAGTATVSGNVSVSGVISGNGSGLTGITPNSLPNIEANKITGVLGTANIPALDASKITTGKFSIDRIPQIPATNIAGPGTILSPYITNTLSGDRLFANNVGIGMSSGTPASRLQLVSADLTGTSIRLDNTSGSGNNWLLESAGTNPFGGQSIGSFLLRHVTTGRIGLSVANTGDVTVPNSLTVNGGLNIGSRSVVVNSGTENLRIVRGTVKATVSGGILSSPQILAGTGYTPSASIGTRLVIDYDDFTGIPTVTVSQDVGLAIVTSATASNAIIALFGLTGAPVLSGSPTIQFIAIGPR